MPGGLLNLISYGNMNVILNGNPSKTFFKTTYSKYTNFGLQKFRIDFDGLRTLRLTEDSHFSFRVPRYADLFMDTYFVITLPTIWSPIFNFNNSPDSSYNVWPYEFKWIENIGAQLIRRVRYMIGGQVIQEFTGQYLYNMVKRDFSEEKKKLFDEMTGNVPELNDPANYAGRNGNYPNAVYNESWLPAGPEPSIRARTLYIPLNVWSTLSSKLAIPLVSLQYNFLHIEVDCRPIQELFVIRSIPSRVLLPKFNEIWNSIMNGDFTDTEGLRDIELVGTYVQGNQNDERYRFFRFLHPPPPSDVPDNTGHITGTKEGDQYPSRATNWFADMHLMSTYAFLSEDEVRRFAANPQCYLIKEVHEQMHFNVTGNNRQSVNSHGLVASWMWFFQRSDVALRNTWSNYTNWATNELPYKGITNMFGYENLYRHKDNPSGMYEYCTKAIYPVLYPPTYLTTSFMNYFSWTIDPASSCCYNTYQLPNPYLITGPLHVENQREIMQNWGVLFDGKVRENTFGSGVNNYIDKYIRTAGNAQSGLYCYNFCLTTDPFQYQPSGAVNLSKFNNIEFEFSTHIPPLDHEAQTFTICDSSGDVIGINKPVWRLYRYNFNMYVMEERYNLLTFMGGTANLSFAR